MSSGSDAGSVTLWVTRLKAGEQEPAQKLWENYFHQLVDRARRKLGATPHSFADEEDVALSAFSSFCHGAQKGRFPKLNDRNDLWQLLVVITERKVIDLVHYEKRAKRGGGRVVNEGALVNTESATGGARFANLESPDPTPEFAAQVADEYRRLLGLLPGEELRTVAVWKMEGYTIEEIAEKLQCVPRTVDRKLKVIRKLWEKEINP